MSWEYSKYEAQCENCGKKGFCIRGSDDWNRTSVSWEGFENQEPHPSAVARKKANRRDAIGVCDCGSSKIVVGAVVQDT